MYCPLCRSEYADDWKVCPKDAAALLRNQFIGKYRIDQILGVGGMGAVYRAYNPDTQSTVAVKLMHGGTSANDAARQRFQREAASVAALRTRHVVSIYDFGSDVDGTLYLVMEYLQGHSLRSEITPMPNMMPLPRVNFVIEQTLRGLGAAHRAGIVHRDLKPENLFVADTDDGEVVKILDFGIARVQRGDTPNLTHSGALMGTPAYMAPEQVAGNRGQVGRHSDVYAIGVILYEMVTGMSPFNAETLSEVLSKILSRQFTPLAQIRPDLPIAVSQLVDRALADDPAQRFGSADALREAWAAAWSQLPAEIRNAPVASLAAQSAAANADRAPGIGNATDVPSAPTAMPAHLMQRPATPVGDGYAATAAHDSAPGTVPGSRQARPGTDGFDPNKSVTPGPVVVDSGTQQTPRSRTGLWIGLGAVVLAAAALVFVLMNQNKGARSSGGTTPAADAGKQIAVTTPDAGVQVEKVPDAGVAVAAPDAGAVTPEGAEMVQFPGGTFKMGIDPKKAKTIPDAESFLEVSIPSFSIDKHEMAGPDGLPIVSITWSDAAKACKDAGKRLPTAAEWEFAARSAKLSAKDANLKHQGKGGPVAPGSFAGDCTPDGLCDMLGNVMEWTDSNWPKKAGHKVVRGASFNISPDAGWYASIQARLPFAAKKSDKEIGFRCAKD